MRRLVAHGFGEPAHVLTVADVPAGPAPAAGQVRLAVQAVGLNFLDVLLCRGTYPQRPDPPFTPGVEAAGRVVQAGAGVGHLSGRDVIACPTLPAGALADEVTVDAALVVPRPPELAPEAAAAIPVIYQTAWFALERARVRAGDTVLIHAGAGGVGIATTQLAVARGARVLCAAGGPAKTAVCRQHGAEVAVDYQREDVVAAVLAATDGRGADVVVDPVGGPQLTRALDCLAFEGRLVVVGAAAGPPPPVDPMALAAANRSLIGLSWGSSYPWRRRAQVGQVYQNLFELHRTGALRPPVSAVVPLERAPQALADLAARRTTGKLVVTMGGH